MIMDTLRGRDVRRGLIATLPFALAILGIGISIYSPGINEVVSQFSQGGTPGEFTGSLLGLLPKTPIYISPILHDYELYSRYSYVFTAGLGASIVAGATVLIASNEENRWLF